MTPVDKLIQTIQQTLQNGGPAQNADKLAADFAHWCATANRRLEQCERLLEGQVEQEALQLAETPPSLLDLCAALSFDKAEQWRELCRNKNLPLPEELNERAISHLNDLYAKGITSSHPLYRDYRESIAERDDERSLSIIRAIVRLNPSDANARQEIQRLEGKVRDAACDQLMQAVQRRDTAAILAALEIVEASGWVDSVNSSTLNQARAVRQERDRELAFTRCCGLVTLLDRLKDREVWNEALGPIQEVEQLCATHGITLGTEATQTFDEVRIWARGLKNAYDAEQEFQAALRQTAFLVEKGETNDGPGTPHNLKSLREEQHILGNQWREVEAFAKPVSEDLQTRVKRRMTVLQAEIDRLVRQKKLITTVGSLAGVVLVGIATLLIFRWRWANNQIADLEKLEHERQVTSEEKFIADLRHNKSKAILQSKLAFALQKSEQWITTERQRLNIFREMLDRLERHQQSNFKDATVEAIAKEWQQTRDFIKELAPEFRNTGEAQLLEFENRFDAQIQILKREIEATLQAELKHAEELVTSLERPDLTLLVVRQTVTELANTLDHLDILANPTGLKLPVSLTARVAPLRARFIPYQTAVNNIEKANADLRQTTTLIQYYEALGKYDAENLHQLTEVRAARKVGGTKLTELEVERLLLMPNDADGWQALIKNPLQSSLPTEVMPAELSQWLNLRDDDNLRNIYRYQMPVTDDGKVQCSPLIGSNIIYTRGPWRKPILDSIGLRFTAMAFIPTTDAVGVDFTEINFKCQCSSNEPITESKLDQRGGLCAEALALRVIGLDSWINDSGDKFKHSLLPVLDELRAREGISPLFKAYVHFRLLKIMAIRPYAWGGQVMAMMENDRAALKKLGADELRSSDWMLPIRIQIWEKKLSDFYGRTQSMSYVRQAHFFERLFTETHAAGMKYAGYVGADGEPVLLNQGTRSHSIWGLNANELQLSLLWSSHANGTVPLDKPQPFSPLFCSGREPSELLRITSENAHLDWQSDFIKDYLPPLFQKELKP